VNEAGRRFRFENRQVIEEGTTPVPARVSPTDRVRAKIDELFASDRELPEILEEVARLGAQLLMQAALEAEVTEFLGRDRYQRGATAPEAQAGSRNGYRPVTVKTTAGPVTLERPKLRGTTAALASRLFGKHVTKTHALESLVIASFVRGLSVRDVEATLADALGDQASISKSTVSQVCSAIKTEYEAWAQRRLEEVVLDYLFLDASFFRMHPGSPAEPVLAAWGITTGGKPVFVGLAPGSGESTDAWADFLTDLRDRGLACPLLVVSDGARGLIAAIEQVFPAALRQRCLIHRSRKVTTCCFVAQGISVLYGGDGRGRPWFGRAVRGGVAASERAAAAAGAGRRGQVAGAWWGASRSVGGRVSETTVRKGVFELEAGEDPLPDGRVRRAGGGRRNAEEIDPQLVPALMALVEPDERGDPESPLRWTTKSLRHLADELTRSGHPVSAPTVGRLLKAAGFSLQANVKTLEGAQHPDRDAQFRYINEQVKAHQGDGDPVISVDTKKREQLGRLPMAGREWRPAIAARAGSGSW
jgi:hypothetical protein